MDMDLDELCDGPKQQALSRPSRFAPKGSKFKPKPQPKAEPSSSPATSSLPAPKKEEVDVNPEVKPEHDAVAMDVELNLGERKIEVVGDFMEIEAAEVGVEHGDGDGDGGEDEVVREIDVYFAPSVDPETQLYLFQYPLRPLWRPYELDERCQEVRVKPTSAEVEVDLAIDVDPKNYDATDDQKLQMDKQTLARSWKPPKANGCTVGVLTGNKLHLNPIHAVVQLRPSMRHLALKESKKRTDVGNGVDMMKLEEKQEGKPSGMSKKQKAPEPIKDSEEEWVPLKYHSVNSDMTAGYLQKMVAREGSEVHFSMSPDDYLNSLCPGTFDDSLSSKGPLRRSLLAKPLNERFKTWLLEGPPLHRFDTLKYLAPDDSIEEVLAVLQELAVLVQGLWAPRTSLVYGAEGIGIAPLARNYVLLLFSKDVIIKDEQLPKSPPLVKAMKDVLHGLATYRNTLKDWKLKELPDLNFIRLNPAIVKKEQEMWERVEKSIECSLSGGRNRPGVKTLISSAPTNLVESKGSGKLGAGPSSGSTSQNVMPEEGREAIKKALQKLFKSTKTCSFQQIIPRLREMALNESARSRGSATEAVAAVNSIDAYPNEFQAIISEVAVNVHGICVPISSHDNKDYDKIRKVVIDLFLAEGPNARLRKAHIIEAVNLQIKDQVVTEAVYKKVLQELCVSQGSGWVLRNDDSNLKR